MSSNIEIKKKCKWCGQIFIAHKTTTNYCSHRCNNAAYKERIRQERIASYQKEFSMNAEEPSIENKEFYTPPEAAKLLGISRASIYRYMADNVIKAVQFKGKTLVRRKDIELLFENTAKYKKRVPIEKAPITDFYTTAEVKEKF
uniref:helix-turn-helix domain-containing protein n=2 Tax=Bacteroides TaxID=816 RepID=UPI0030146D58